MSSTDLQTLARALGGELSGGQVLCPGPGHSATDRSLRVKLDDGAPDGFVTHSFAGDDPIVCRDHVRKCLGLEPFKPNGGGHRQERATDDMITKAVLAAARAQGTATKPRGKIVATYDYRDEHGALLYQVVRYEPKDFRQRRPDGSGGWAWSAGERRVLYRLPELVQFPDATVFVCEGEKDADRVAPLGHCATTVAGGKWTDDCVKALAGRDILVLEDSDEAGRKKALAAAELLYGTANTVRIVRLPGLTGEPNNKDVSDWLDASPRGADKFVDICFDAPVWQPHADSRKNEAKADTNAATAATSENADPPLPFINVVAWHEQPVPEREWAVRDRIPLRNVTLLSGEGAVGKSILALHLSIAHVLGRDWLGTLPEPGPAIVMACEDDDKELHRRCYRIITHFGATFSDLRDFHPMSLAGEDALLAVPDRNGLIQPTKLFAHLREAACDIKPKLIVLDNSADVFGGNENDRAQVRQFIGILRGLAISANAGVLLTAHPSLTGISTGTGLSGSTAWHASVRSRLFFKKATTEKGEEPDPDRRVLEVMKNNYGPAGETIPLRWKDGLFLPVTGMSTLERLAREQKVDELFLKLLDRWIKQGRNVSDKRTANTYAPSRFAAEPEAKADHVSKHELAEAMERLFRVGKIHVVSYGLPSKGWTRIERK